MYKINYIGGADKTYICPITGRQFIGKDMNTSGFRAYLFNNGIDYNDPITGNLTKRNQPFLNHCQIFVSLKLNHPGMKHKLNEIRRNARKKSKVSGVFNSEENDANMQYHVTLLQIYVNVNHPKFRTFLDKKEELLTKINTNFLAAFVNESFTPLTIKKLGDKFIVLDLSINDETFYKYVNAKRDFYTMLNEILSEKPRTKDSYYFDKDKRVTGTRFFFDNQPFLFIKDHYLTKNGSNGKPINNFIPHLSVLSLQDIVIEEENISELKEGVSIPDPIDISGEFSIKSNISIHNKSKDEEYLNESDVISNDGTFSQLAFREDYFLNYLVNLIKYCNS